MRSFGWGFLAAVALSAVPLLGAPINYGSYSGNTVIFQNVTEDSSTDPVPLFGAPTQTADSLSFSPVSFGASASGAGGVDLTDGTLAMKLQAKPGFGVHSFALSEAGDYTIAGSGGTSATTAQVSATIFIRVLEVDNAGVTPFGPDLNLIFTPTGTPPTAFGGQYHYGPDSGIGVIWSGGTSVDIDAVLAGAGYGPTHHATLVSVTMDNTLLAVSEAGTVSFIKKKALDGVTITVPEPGMLSMLLIGAMALSRRR
jgi:hypothetical protein